MRTNAQLSVAYGWFQHRCLIARHNLTIRRAVRRELTVLPTWRHKMRQYLIAALLALSGTLSYGDDSSRSREQVEHRVLKVFDSQGKTVGPLVSYSGQDGVNLTVNGATIFVTIGRVTINNGRQYSASQFEWGSVGFVTYPTPDCSGNPVIVYYTTPVRPAMAVRQGVDVTVYIASDSFSGPVAVASARQNPNLSQCQAFSYPQVGWTPEATYDLTGHYPEPLRLGY